MSHGDSAPAIITPPSTMETLPPAKSNGSMWICLRDEKLWPTVICDENKVPRGFMQTRPDIPEIIVLPAIQLGKHKFIWVKETSLREFEQSKDYSDGLWLPRGREWHPVNLYDDTERARCNAFHLDLELWQDDDYWINYLLNEQEARRLDTLTRRPKQFKRSREVVELSDEDDEDDEADSDHEVEFVASHKRNSLSKNPRKRLRKHRETNTNDRLSASSPTQKEKHRQIDGNGLAIRLGQNPTFDPGSSARDHRRDSVLDADDDEDGSLEERREKHRQQVIDKGLSYKDCTVFVGHDHTPFILSRDDLGQCDYLTAHMRHDPELRNYVNLYEELDITTHDFHPVWTYLTTKEFTPRLLERESPTVEGVFMPETKEGAVEQILVAYLAAVKLYFGQLQDLCVRKFKAMYPLPTVSLMLVIMRNEGLKLGGYDNGGELREWLVDHTAEQFFALYAENNLTMGRVMEEHGEFREDVVEKLPSFRKEREKDMG